MTYRFDIPVTVAGILEHLPSDATNHLPRVRSDERGDTERNR
jgi:hypothetical protein